MRHAKSASGGGGGGGCGDSPGGDSSSAASSSFAVSKPPSVSSRALAASPQGACGDAAVPRQIARAIHRPPAGAQKPGGDRISLAISGICPNLIMIYCFHQKTCRFHYTGTCVCFCLQTAIVHLVSKEVVYLLLCLYECRQVFEKIPSNYLKARFSI